MRPKLRKTFGCLYMDEDGSDVTELASIMGHRKIETTWKYYLKISEKKLHKGMARFGSSRKKINENNLQDKNQDNNHKLDENDEGLARVLK